MALRRFVSGRIGAGFHKPRPQDVAELERIESKFQMTLDFSKDQVAAASRLFPPNGGSFVDSIAHAKQIKPPTTPEVVFLGRSNAGKSTLLNTLLSSTTDLVRMSRKPGFTKMLNVFATQNRELHLIDCPGYGFRSRYAWMNLIGEYVEERPNTRATLLVDSKAGLMESDLFAASLLDEAAVPFQLCITKIDQIPPHERRITIQRIWAQVDSMQCYPHPFAVSCKTGEGVHQLRMWIAIASGLASRWLNVTAPSESVSAVSDRTSSPFVRTPEQRKSGSAARAQAERVMMKQLAERKAAAAAGGGGDGVKSMVELHRERKEKEAGGKKEKGSRKGKREEEEREDREKRKKLADAIAREERRSREAERVLKMDERKRPYSKMGASEQSLKPTEEDMEAYHLKRQRTEDPMAKFLGKNDDEMDE